MLVLVVELVYGVKLKEWFEVYFKYLSVCEYSIMLIKYMWFSFYSKYKICVDRFVDV